VYSGLSEILSLQSLRYFLEILFALPSMPQDSRRSDRVQLVRPLKKKCDAFFTDIVCGRHYPLLHSTTHFPLSSCCGALSASSRRLFVIYRQLYGHMSTSSTKKIVIINNKAPQKNCCLNFCLVFALIFFCLLLLLLMLMLSSMCEK